MTRIEENDLKILIAKIENENLMMRKLSTRKGFYASYFENLKNSKTKIEAFNKVNDSYYSLFGTYKFNSFLDFRMLTISC